MRLERLPADAWARHDPSLAQRLVRRLATRPGRLIYRHRAYGHEPRVPAEGGFLLAPGPHGSYVDPFVFALGQNRTRLRFMAKYQALEWPVTGRLIRWVGGFPVHRGGGRSETALDVAKTVVESGDGLVIFMEGHLVLSHEGLGTPRSGLARLALATGVPVVPVAAWGAKRPSAYGRRWWRYRPKVTVVWGAPLQFEREENPDEARVAEVRDAVWAEVSRCFEQARTIAHMPGGRPPAGTPLEAMVLS